MDPGAFAQLFAIGGSPNRLLTFLTQVRREASEDTGERQVERLRELLTTESEADRAAESQLRRLTAVRPTSPEERAELNARTEGEASVDSDGADQPGAAS